MTPELACRARTSLTKRLSVAIPLQGVSDHAIEACEVLSDRLSRIIGENGVNTLFKRSAQQVAQWYSPRLSTNAWSGESDDAPWLWLRARLEQQDSEAATEWFMLVLSMVVDLLQKLVGVRLVAQLLADAWPVAFPQSADEALDRAA